MLRSLRVGPHTYTVRTGGKHDDALAADEANGTHEGDRLRIRVHSRLPESKQREVLLHEVLHACGVDDEAVVTPLAPALLAVLRDNPALVAELTR